MKKVLLLAVSMLAALVAMPAFAAVQNIKVGGDIDSTYVYRDRFDLRGRNGGTTQFEQNLFITQTRLRVDADLSDNVSATVVLLNERPWDEESNANTNDSTDIDLNLAYVKLREMLYSPLTVVVGRQHFGYGNEFIMGSIGTNNNTADGGLNGVAEDLTVRTAYDGIKMIFDYNPLTIDLFAAKVDSNNNAGTGRHNDDVDFFGVNGNYQLGDQWNTTLESYFFTRFDRSLNVGALGIGTGTKSDSIYTPGLRASTNPIKGLNMQGELAWQGGNKASTDTTGAARVDNIPREAMGAQAIVNYQVQHEKVAKWKPVVMGVYTYTSGDSNPSNSSNAAGNMTPASKETWTAWDPMFENQGGGTIYNSLFDLSNSHIAVASAQVSPIEDVTAKLTWTGIWLDKEATDGSGLVGAGGLKSFNMRQPDGTTIQPVITSNKDVGYEIDADFNYNYTEDVKLGLSLGWFVPGGFFDSANNENAKQALAHVGVTF